MEGAPIIGLASTVASRIGFSENAPENDRSVERLTISSQVVPGGDLISSTGADLNRLRRHRRIIGVASGGSTIEGGSIRGVEGSSLPNSCHKIRVCNKETAEGDRIGPPVGQCALARFRSIGTGRKQRAQ